MYTKKPVVGLFHYRHTIKLRLATSWMKAGMLTYSFCKSVGTVLTFFFSYFKPSNTQLYGYMSPTVIENTYNSVHAAGSYGSWLVNAVPCSYIQGLLFNLFFFFSFSFLLSVLIVQVCYANLTSVSLLLLVVEYLWNIQAPWIYLGRGRLEEVWTAKSTQI